MSIKVDFDPQRAELEALDNAFYGWLDKQSDMSEYEKHDMAREFQGPEPLTYTQEDIDEGWAGDWEEAHETLNLAMERNMQDRIEHKRRFLESLD